MNSCNNNTRELFLIISSGKAEVDVVENYINEGVDLTSQWNNCTFLELAYNKGLYDIVCLIAKAIINIKSEWNYSSYGGTTTLYKLLGNKEIAKDVRYQCVSALAPIANLASRGNEDCPLTLLELAYNNKLYDIVCLIAKSINIKSDQDYYSYGGTTTLYKLLDNNGIAKDVRYQCVSVLAPIANLASQGNGIYPFTFLELAYNKGFYDIVYMIAKSINIKSESDYYVYGRTGADIMRKLLSNAEIVQGERYQCVKALMPLVTLYNNTFQQQQKLQIQNILAPYYTDLYTTYIICIQGLRQGQFHLLLNLLMQAEDVANIVFSYIGRKEILNTKNTFFGIQKKLDTIRINVAEEARMEAFINTVKDFIAAYKKPDTFEFFFSSGRSIESQDLVMDMEDAINSSDRIQQLINTFFLNKTSEELKPENLAKSRAVRLLKEHGLVTDEKIEAYRNQKQQSANVPFNTPFNTLMTTSTKGGK